MRISILVPALKNAGPILVARDIISNLVNMYPNDEVFLFYFDQLDEPLNVACPTYWIKDKSKLTHLFTSDIVHSHGIRPDYFIYKNRSKIKGKCLSTLHGIYYEEYKLQYGPIAGKLIEAFWTYILRKHNSIVVLTNIMKQHYTKSIPVSKMTVIKNGRDLSHHDIDPDDKIVFKKLKENYKVLGVACVMTKRKGLRQVVEVLPFMPHFALVAIGEGPEKVSLEARAKELGVADRCHFLGSRLEASRYNRYFDFYIFPSYMEGLPLALLEAAGASKAIIVSDINIHREIFSEEEVSYFDLDAPEALIEAIKNADLKRASLEKNAKSIYLQKFTSCIMAQSYYEHYNTLLKEVNF